MQEVGGSVEAEMIKLSRDNFPLKAIKLQNLLEQSILLSRTFFQLHTFQVIELCQQTYIIHSGFISGYQNRYGDNLKPPTNVYHRMTA